MKHQNASTGEIMDDDSPDAHAAETSTKSMHIKVYSPFRVYFDDMADSITGINGTGTFDILPQHHNFLSLLSPCDLIVRSNGTEKRIRISRGVIHVKKNAAIVFLDV